MIAVMGASGNTGGPISDQLLQRGEKIRALGRSSERLAGLERKGADVRTGDASDAAFLTNAFRDADAVYTLLPPDPRSPDLRKRKKWDQEGEAIVKAIRDSGVRYVVFLSSVGADLPEGTGPIARLHAQEERLRKLPDVNALILRPAWFFENFYAILGLIKDQGINGSAVAPDLRLPMIATCDIADVAAHSRSKSPQVAPACAHARRPAGSFTRTFMIASAMLGASESHSKDCEGVP